MKFILSIPSLIILMLINHFVCGLLVFGTIFSLIQILFVFYLFYVGKFHNALVLHIIFIVTSINFVLDSSGSASSLASSYNYSKLRFFGTIPISFILSFVFYICTLRTKNKKCKFNNFCTQYFFLNLIAFLLGFIGLLLLNYSISYFVSYFYYSATVLLILYILKNNSNDSLFNILKKSIEYLLIAAPIFSLILFFFGTSSVYGGIKTAAANSLFLFSPFLLLFELKTHRYLRYLAIFSFLIISVFSIGGKGVFFLIIVLIFKAINLFKDSKSKLTGIFSIILFSFIISIAIAGLFSSANKNDYLMFHKVNQFASIFSFNGSLDDVSDSPKVRIAEILNILYYFKDNPARSIFGFGYGGYFQDYTGLFSIMNITVDSFDEDQINTGKFYRPHDTLPVILLLHGFLGILFLFYWTIISIVMSRSSYYLLGVLPWLFLTYGFDINIAIVGIIFLYIGFYKLKPF